MMMVSKAAFRLALIVFFCCSILLEFETKFFPFCENVFFFSIVG